MIADKKILLIEDNPYKAEDILNVLDELDISDIETVKDKESAIGLMELSDYDIILLDMYFPQYEGGPEYPMCGMRVLDYLEEKNIATKVIITSTASIDYDGRKNVVGQVLYGVDDTYDGLLKNLLIIDDCLENEKKSGKTIDIVDEAISKDISSKLSGIIHDINSGKSIEKIAKKNSISIKLTEEISRMYLTHPGVDKDGILQRLGI